MIPYVSIDIETTGLNPATCQVLEIGAVIDDWETPVEDLPKFRAILKHDTIKGEPFALQMNADLLKLIATIPATPLAREGGMIAFTVADPEIDALDPVNAMRKPSDVTDLFLMFLDKHGIDTKKGFQPAGKNFASFDRPFLEAGVPGWQDDVKIKHRTIDPGSLFWRPGVEYIPDTKTCNERANLPPLVAHTAVEDAIGVVNQIREHKRNCDRIARDLEFGTKFIEAFGLVQASIHPSLKVNVNDPIAMAREIIRYNSAPPIGGAM